MSETALSAPAPRRADDRPLAQGPDQPAPARRQAATMEASLTRYIWGHTRRDQLWIVFIILVSMPTYFMSLDIPKQIVNGPIQGEGFTDATARAPFLGISFDVPAWLSSQGAFVLFEGFSLNRLQTLIGLSFAFLALVVVNGLFKFYINTYKGRLGERMLRRMRYELVDLVLRFPPGQFKRVKPSEVATMVKDEVEPLGGFIGDIFTQPAFLGGQALTALVFIVVQNLWLGLLAGGMVGIQGLVIPRMRRRLIRLGRERQLTARALSGRVGEIVDGIAAVHANDTSNYERAEIAARLGRIFKIRYDLYQWKFFVKFLNNFLAQVTPFFFYLIGGYLALKGRLDIGQLIAVIAAYKDLPGPIKELIDWDQQRVDVQVKYAQVVEQFSVDELLHPSLQAVLSDPIEPLDGPLVIAGLSVTDDSGARLLESASLEVRPGEKLAILGTPGGGAEALADTLARLHWPQAGGIRIGEADLLELPEAVTGRRMAYASSDAPLPQGSVRDVLLYALKHAPYAEASVAGDGERQRAWERHEARRSGNPEFDIRDDWIDYAAVGGGGAQALPAAVERVLVAVDLSQDLFDLSLRAAVDPASYPGLADAAITARAALRERLAEDDLADAVVPFDPADYNDEAPLVENLLFGTPVGTELADGRLAANPYFRSVLVRHGLEQTLLDMGVEIAGNVIELFRDLPANHPFFEQLTFMAAEELPQYQALVQRLKGKTFAQVAPADRDRIISLAFSYVEPRHRFGLLTEELQARIVEARRGFREGLPADLEGAIEFYDPAKYNKAASLLDNILFGRIAQKRADSDRRVRALVRDLLSELGLTAEVIEIGLDFNVGVAGKRLTLAQRQKIHMARALIKRPDIAVFNKPLNALELRAQDHILANVLELLDEGGRTTMVLWVLSHPLLAKRFERIVVFDRGRPVEEGSFDELANRKGIFSELLS